MTTASCTFRHLPLPLPLSLSHEPPLINPSRLARLRPETPVGRAICLIYNAPKSRNLCMSDPCPSHCHSPRVRHLTPSIHGYVPWYKAGSPWAVTSRTSPRTSLSIGHRSQIPSDVGLHGDTCLGLRGIRGVLRLLDLGNQELKGLGHVLVVPSTSFGPATAALLCHLSALLGAHLALLGAQVALVADDDDRDGVSSLDGAPKS